jgi:L-threonylcarbamoyladenylate synthase
MDLRISDDVVLAAEKLIAGHIVAFPTETVYGLGADASNPDAVRRVYDAKNRPHDHPLIVHVGSVDLVSELAMNIPDIALSLAEKFWPGPLTLVLQKTDKVSDTVTGGQDTVAIRIPNHPFALSLLNKVGRGVVGPSANKFGRLSPTRAQDVAKEFNEEVSFILNGGPCHVGIESTIIGFEGDAPVVLRPGMITADQVSLATGRPVKLAGLDAPRVPGALPAHYAPRTKLMVLPRDELVVFYRDNLKQKKLGVVMLSPEPSELIDDNLISAPNDAASYATLLYKTLRSLDRMRLDLILVEAVPSESEWDGIRDRLTRAARGS